jgi:hypothetical protein
MLEVIWWLALHSRPLALAGSTAFLL